MTGLTIVGLLIAFGGGILSFASPCCLPLIPAYVSYMVGTTGGSVRPDGRPDRRPALAHGLSFVLGFSLVFVAFWASIGLVGYVLAGNARILHQLGGGLLVFLGLQTAGVINVRLLWSDTRAMPVMGGLGSGGVRLAAQPSYGRSAAFGALFAAGWSPCIGPILGGIIGLASASASVGEGTALLIAYAAGLAVPFLAVALGADAVAQRLGWVGRHHQAVSRLTGLLLVAIGLLMITNLLGRLAQVTSPFGL
ncbi:MAG TPA: cytochrome c biogenesis protein CcdA [Candidatus Limnocylindrales bacterium]|nr:cytochrome c biogenesis protein CcdA [Candidatus Limnocylindrales bacterium]